MTALAFREDTQLIQVPPVPVMTRFWGPRGTGTAAAVSTLPKLARAPEPDLYLDRLYVAPDARGAVRAVVRIGPAIPFSAGAEEFILEHDEE